MTEYINDKHPLTDRIQSNRVRANAIFVVLYSVISLMGSALTLSHGHMSPIWPASGLAIASVLVCGRSLLPGLFIGALISNLLIGNELFASISISAGSLLEAYVAYLLLKPAKALSALLGSYTIPGWVIVSSILAPIVAAFLGVFGECFLNHGFEGTWDATLWRIWWISHTVGILIVTPVCLYLRPIKFSISQALQLFAFIVVSAIAYTLIFRYGTDTPVLFLAFPVLLLACLWFGRSGCALSTLSFAIFSILANGHDAYDMMDAAGHMEHIFLFDIFLLVLGFTSMALSSFYQKERFLIPSLLLITGWLISGWVYNALHSASNRIDEISFRELIADSENSIFNRYNSYVDALRASAAFYQEARQLSRPEWRNFIAHLALQERYPGINGLGIVLPLTELELNDYIQTVRASGLPKFAVTQVPGVSRPPVDRLGYAHYVVDRIEPIEANSKILGLDLASEVKRQNAAAVARDTGNPAITESINILLDDKAEKGFSLYMPMYQEGMPLDTIDQRRDAFFAWTYAPFITNAFFEGILRQKSNKLDFAVFDKEQISKESFIYTTDPKWDPLKNLSFEHLTKIEIGEQRYAFVWKRGPGFARSEVYSASIAAASLALGTCFLAGIVVSLQSTNRSANRIVEIRTAELQEVNETLRAEIIERKRAKENAEEAQRIAEAANLAKSEFLATMSHEIRTPMNSVLGFSELLSASKQTNEQSLWTSYIRGSGQSLLAIINDILDFSKIEAGKMELERIAFSPKQALEEVVGSFTTTANEKGIYLELKPETSMPDQIMGDPIRFKQIATNLIGNGIKFTEHGKVRIEASWNGPFEDGQLKLIVSDTGIGIHPEKLKMLFEKFTQVDSSTTRRFGGTGLGLAICKKLIELMDGKVEATSILNKGTTMVVEIPFKGTKEATETKQEPVITEVSTENNQATYTASVLLVDDNAVNRKLGMTILQRMGCQVTLACDGQEAVEAVKAKPYSIVFMDCRMPVMDGFDATRSIRKLEQAGVATSDKPNQPLPILALTANVTEENRQECLDAGMNDHLRKPCKISDFKTALNTFHLGITPNEA